MLFRSIFEIHLRRRGRDPKQFDLDRLAAESGGFSGAEIEQAVIAGLYAAFEGERDLTTDDIVAAIKQTVALSVTMKEDIDLVRRWAKGRARPASVHALADLQSENGEDLDGQTDWVQAGIWAAENARREVR